MKLLWDEPKRIANLKKHGLNFGDAPLFDWTGALIEPARTDRFGRTRFKAIGRFEEEIAAIIFAALGSEAISIVSFRPAKAKERRKFRDQA